jgi:hypothetical protein
MAVSLFRVARASTTSLLLLFLSACCCASLPAPYLAVREGSRRWENALPLTPDSKASLLKFLKRGGDATAEADAFPGAAEQFGKLLDLLASPATTTSRALEGDAFRPWFRNSTTQVIDAREPEPRPLSNPFIAYESGVFGWVFRSGNDDRLDRLTVFRLSWK